MTLDFRQIEYTFLDKPLLIGGKAMEFYGLRKAGADIDLVVSARDHAALVALYPEHVRNLFGDIGVCVHGFEIWNRIMLFDYPFLREHSIAQADFLVIALDKLLFLKSLAMHIEKYHHDMELIVAKIQAIQYGKDADYPSDLFLTRGRK